MIEQPDSGAARPAPTSTDPGNGNVLHTIPVGTPGGTGVHFVPGSPMALTVGLGDRTTGLAAANMTPEAAAIAVRVATSGANMPTPTDPVSRLHDAAQAANGGQL